MTTQPQTSGVERERMASDRPLSQRNDWYLWGPYLSERQWGTVREDYSADGEAWGYLSHDRARATAYRWGEDGLAGFSDIEQRLCLGLALWNGRDPILKERPFGLTGAEANHGEDVKDYWWYLDAVPSHAWNRWRYHYPQGAFPYEDLRAENGRRGKHDPEYELLDTGAFDEDRYWIVEVHYAKASPTDLLMSIQITNAGPDPETLHVLPTAWFRNTWSWNPGAPRPELAATGDTSVRVSHPSLGELELLTGPGPDGTLPSLLFCENETNTQRLYGVAGSTQYPKDGINDHIVTGAPTVDPAQRGTKCAAWYRVDVAPGATAELRLRLRPAGSGADTATALGPEYDEVFRTRRAEADEFYADLTPMAASPDEAMVMRQAFAGMLWSKQLYYYDVARWLDGDPGQPVPLGLAAHRAQSPMAQFQRLRRDVDAGQVGVPLVRLLGPRLPLHRARACRPGVCEESVAAGVSRVVPAPERRAPAYEWDFGDVNPPVQVYAALEVWAIDGGRDLDFLSRIFDKLLVNFTWWVNREDADGSNLFEGGFLGLDNIGPLDRSHLPVGGVLEQSDATGWMAAYALGMMTIAAILNRTGHRPARDLVHKFLEHFAEIRTAMAQQGMWDDTDGLFYDRISTPSGGVVPVKVHSMVGIIPMLAVGVIDEQMLAGAIAPGKQFAEFLDRQGLRDRESLAKAGLLRGDAGQQRLLMGVVGVDQVLRLFDKLFDPGEFLSPYGLRSISAFHRDHPYTLEVEGIRATVDYEPAESTTDMFGGNSNWRGPVWFPLNFLAATAMQRYHRFFGEDLMIEYPTGSGHKLALDAVADDLFARLVSIFLVGPDGKRPCFGGVDRLQQDPNWKDNLMFSEYFHGDNAAGLGAAHQTGWTGIVADLIRRRHGSVQSVGDVLRTMGAVS